MKKTKKLVGREEMVTLNSVDVETETANDINKSFDVNFSIQDYFSAGYIYILILGILKDSVFYYFLGINIFNYSTIVDVLLSPINILGRHPLMLATFVIFSLFIIYLPSIIEKYKDKKWYQMLSVEKEVGKVMEKPLIPTRYVVYLVFVSGFFCGQGIGGGASRAEDIKNQELEITDQITYMDDRKIDVRILGQNSTYLFYYEQGDKVISVSPIQGNIKKIEENILKKEE